MATSMGGEALEEMISGAVNPALQGLYNGKGLENYRDFDVKEMLYSGLIGLLMGGLGNVGSLVTGQSRAKNAQLRSAEQAGQQIKSWKTSAEDVQAYIETGLQSRTSTEAYKLARQAQRKLARGEELTDYELGRLFQANVAAVEAEVGRPSKDTKTKFSLEAFEDGTRFVNVSANRREFDGLTAAEQQKLAKKIIMQKFRQSVIGIDNPAFVNKRIAEEYAYPAKFIDDVETKEAKMRTAAELDNLLDAGYNRRTAEDGADGHTHGNASGGFEYYDVLFKVGDQYFQGVINIINNGRGKLLKDVTKIRNATKDTISSYGENPKSEFLRDVSMSRIQ